MRVAPSLLAADFSRLEAELEAVRAKMLHLDVMDGHFVPNISFGVPVIASLRKRTRMFFDAH
ncbi:MAG: ribulose-phosphate 3-epimerase, partial [Planctomycetota bacterium]